MTRPPTGNTFHGLIEEFPGVCIDKFNETAKLYLLSHFHTDHVVGLDNKYFNKFIYCSEITRQLLVLDPRYLAVWPLIKTLLPNQRHTVLLDDQEIYITLIPTIHCPGSTMFLIESESKAVLLTGDMRAEPWWTESLRSSPFLFPYTTKMKTLDNIYFDSTFAYRGEPYIDMVSNYDGITTAIELLSLYPQNDAEIQFYFQDSCLGFEEAWSAIISSIGGSLHCSDLIRRRIGTLLQYGHRSGEILHQATRKHHQGCSTKFHACGKHSECQGNTKFPVRIKQCIDFNIMDFAGVFCPFLAANISAAETEKLLLVDETSMGNKIYKFRQKLYILPKEGEELLPADIKLVFSRHSSFSETFKFISLFSPRLLYPCTYSKALWLNGFSMLRLFGIKNTTYDSIMSNIYGPLTNNVPVANINRWLIAQCEKEQNLVRKFLSGSVDNYRFMGQFLFSRLLHRKNNNVEVVETTRLLKLIARRRDEFKEFIEQQQNKYAFFSEVGWDEKNDNRPQYDCLGGHTDSDTDRNSSKEMFRLRLDIGQNNRSRKRPCLVRADKPIGPSTVKIGSQIFSSRASVELSFARMSHHTLSVSVVSRFPLHLDHSIFCETPASVDDSRIIELTKTLQSNANSWLDIQFDM